jgi:predicted RecB family nuclease
MRADDDPQRYVRLDVSAVRSQGAYIAKQCPVVAHNRNDSTITAEPAPPSEAVEHRLEGGRVFERAVIKAFSEQCLDLAIVAADSPSPTETTLAAMRDGVQVVAGGHLPDDMIGHRVGRPDVLIRDGPAPGPGGRWAYLPVDIKHHLTLQDDPGGAFGPASCSAFDSPSRTDAEALPDRWSRKRFEDVMQLAHYWRMLEACGHAADGIRVGGIVGVERTITWFDLDQPKWRSGGKPRSTFERYDFEFAFRLDIIARALEQGRADAEPPLVVPLFKSDCAECEWRELCVPRLEETDDVTLVPKVGYVQWRVHVARGVTTRRDLAALDWRTANLIDKSVDVARWLDQAEGLPDDASIDDVPTRAHKQPQTLQAADVRTVGELRCLDAQTAKYSDASLSSLAKSIDLARVGLAREVVRTRGVDSVIVPRGDIELDIDLECYGERVYLWGVLTSRRGSEESYESFVTFGELDDEHECEVFRRFWASITEARAAAAAEQLTLRAYCHSAGTENRFLRSAARRFAGMPAVPDLDEIDAFINGDEWVDMRVVVGDHLITPVGTGLKVLAPFAGFRWRDDDPGGEQSLNWYELAVADPDESIRAENRERLVAYNEDDCRAMLALRAWLTDEGDNLRSIEDLPRPT